MRLPRVSWPTWAQLRKRSPSDEDKLSQVEKQATKASEDDESTTTDLRRQKELEMQQHGGEMEIQKTKDLDVQRQGDTDQIQLRQQREGGEVEIQQVGGAQQGIASRDMVLQPPSSAETATTSGTVVAEFVPVTDTDPIPISHGPPPLNYTLRTRKRSIAIFWSLILIDTIAVPIALYFGLWYGTDLSPNDVFSISTGALGGVSIIEYLVRLYRLIKKDSTCRVIGCERDRYHLDWFHWNFTIAWFFIMAELVIGTVFTNPPIRLLAMPVSSLCFWFAFQMLILDTLRILGYKSHMRISSMPKGSHLRPGIYAIIEDVVAVDGSGGTEFRRRLNTRYTASKDFRMMLHRLTLFWGFGALITAVLTTTLIFTIERDAAYVCGWVIPFLWAGPSAYLTILYVKRCLAAERRDWGRAKKTVKILRV